MDFRQAVIKFVARVPKGRVVSYGQVAAACGKPRAARVVGGILRGLDANSPVPWWRVINNQGIISIKGNWTASKELQAQLLRAEGVIVKTLKVDIEKHRWQSEKNLVWLKISIVFLEADDPAH